MITRIEAATGFGILRNFLWNPDLQEFGKQNLIYGWNYSGKTTLSRIFQALEQKELNSEYPGASFRVKLEDGSGISSTALSSSPIVRVFNRDYVNQNFREEFSAPAVFILGKTHADLAARLERLKKRRDRIVEVSNTCSEKAQELREQIDRSGTEQARTVRHLLGDPNFDRTKLSQRIEDIRPNPSLYILADTFVSAKLSTLKSVDQFGGLSLIPDSLPDFVSLAQIVNDMLHKTASNQAIIRLKQNPNIESWVRQGLALHRQAPTCEFCSAPLNESRIDELRRHFSMEYERLVEELDKAIERLLAFDMKPQIHDDMRILPEYRPEFIKIKKSISDWLKWAQDLRDAWVGLLAKKRIHIESQLKWDGDLGRAAEGSQLIAELNRLIEFHYKAISGLEKTRAEAKQSLERHFAAVHFHDANIVKTELEIAHLSKRFIRAQGLEKLIADHICRIEAKTDQPAIGAAKLNDFVRYLLTGSNIEVVNVSNIEFQFRRDTQIATHLSEGEKTAIAFAYFLTSLEARGASIADTIIFVDDPVSSLDSNHIYALYALIVKRLETSRQLFVSTHNAELFNLIKSSWLGKNGGNKPETRAYYIWRSSNDAGNTTASLRDLPDLLRKYQSEYEFVFSQLIGFARATNPSLHEAYTAPNLMRKFLEAYVGFSRPNVRDWTKKLDLLFDSPEERHEIAKLADDASHLQSLNRSLQHPEFVSNVKRCVCMVMDALKKRDEQHFDALCEIVGRADL